jgi:hypothetical protein
VKLVGDWGLAARALSGAGGRVTGSMDRALKQEALLLQSMIVNGLRDQTPGGSPIKPLAPNTTAKRALRGFRGTKALIERADLLRSITVETRGAAVFVGVARKAKLKNGEAAVNVAERNEFGGPPISIPMTDRSRRFVFALLARSASPAPTKPNLSGAVIVRVPARPFLRPAFEVFRKEAQARFLQRVAQNLLP